MTEVPDYVLPAGAPAQAVHTEPAKNYQWESLSQDQLNSIRSNLITSILQIVIQAITGIFIPGGGLGGATGQLTDWASNIPIIGDIVQALTGQFGGLDLLGPLTGLFGPLIDFLDGTGTNSGAGNFTDNNDGTGFFDFGLGDLFDSNDGTGMSVAELLQNLLGQLGTFQATQGNQQNIIDIIFNALRGGGITGNQPGTLNEALQNIPSGNVLGVAGPANIGASILAFLDNVVGGLVGSPGSGATLPDAFNVTQQVSSWANLGLNSWNVLGIRTNKSLLSGLLPTSESNIALPHSGGSAPTFGLTQSTAITGFQRISEGAPKAVVSWLGSGTTSLTHFFVNIYQMDPTNGNMTLVHASPNIIGDVSSSLAYNTYQIPTAVDVLPSEVYGIELAVRGAGTHNVVGQSTWLPDHPTVFPKNLAAVRDSGTSAAPSTISSGAIAYASNVPFIEFGINTGVSGDSHTPSTTLINTPVTGATVPFPSWANYADTILMSGGGGGHQGGSIGIGGAGGNSGNWVTNTWQRGTDFNTAEDPTLSVTVGAAGSGGSGNGGNGGNSSVTLPATTGFASDTVTSTGGAGSTSLDILGLAHSGHTPGNITYHGVTYVGGAQQDTYGADGSAPGGGGAGGNWILFQPGGDGAPGAVWIRFYQ